MYTVVVNSCVLIDDEVIQKNSILFSVVGGGSGKCRTLNCPLSYWNWRDVTACWERYWMSWASSRRSIIYSFIRSLSLKTQHTRGYKAKPAELIELNVFCVFFVCLFVVRLGQKSKILLSNEVQYVSLALTPLT